MLAERRSTRRFAEYLAFYRSANTGDYLLWIAGMAHYHLWDWAGALQAWASETLTSHDEHYKIKTSQCLTDGTNILIFDLLAVQ